MNDLMSNGSCRDFHSVCTVYTNANKLKMSMFGSPLRKSWPLLHSLMCQDSAWLLSGKQRVSHARLSFPGSPPQPTTPNNPSAIFPSSALSITHPLWCSLWKFRPIPQCLFFPPEFNPTIVSIQVFLNLYGHFALCTESVTLTVHYRYTTMLNNRPTQKVLVRQLKGHNS